MVQNNLSIIVSSWDGYASAWGGVCHGLTKYWHDCPFPLYFVTNQLDAPCGITIKCGDDRAWTRMIRRAVEQIDTPYILYLQDDYWLDQPVDTHLIYDFLQLIDRSAADYVLVGNSATLGDVYPDDPRLCYIDFNALYRPSLRPALWRKSFFLSLLVEGESIWEFETKGARRTYPLRHRFLANRTPTLSCPPDVIVKGIWTTEAHEYAEREHLTMDFPPLRKLGRAEQLYVRLVPNWHTRERVLYQPVRLRFMLDHWLGRYKDP